MMSNFKEAVSRNLINIPGFRTKRKLVIFESDDWGMQRMPSKEAYNRLLLKGYPVDKSIYNKYDSLEENDDMTALMDVLKSVKDKHGNPAIFTLNNVVANPDFEKIKSFAFNNYYYEKFTETLGKNNHSNKVIDLYRQGIDQSLFQVQFHGREHVHARNWLQKINSGDKIFIDAFNENMFTINDFRGSSCRNECLDALATYSMQDYSFIENSLSDGLKIFKEIWGFNSASIIAPCYTWSSALESIFQINGIKYIQGSRGQRVPISFNQPYKIKRNFCGKKNSEGLIYLMRNVNFEQTENANLDIVSRALKEIENAFFWNKPAVISSHRVNYIGSIVEKNREDNLILLHQLIKKIIEIHPTVEFLSSDKLGELISMQN